MTLKERWLIFKNYTIPHFFIKYFGKYKMSEEGYKFFEFCAKVIQDLDYEAETYQEMIFDERLKQEGKTRREAAGMYFAILMPYVEMEIKNE